MRTLKTRFCLIILAFMLESCSVVVEHSDGPPTGPVNISSIPDAEPREEQRSKYGNPESYVVNGRRYYVSNNTDGFVERGIASWYGTKFHGRRTSSGETYNMYAMSAAHKTLPIPTYVEVTNLRNGKSAIVRVNDRGPFHENRIIDLSYTAAAKLDIIKTGTGLVEIRAINPARYQASKKSPVGKESTIHAALKLNGVDNFFIQVGAFSSLLNASKLKEKLGGLGEDLTRISTAVLNGKTIYRVRIGPIYNIDNADRIVTALGRYGIMDHHIVIE